MIAVKHVTTDPRNGSLIYRRRVPKAWAGMVGQTLFVKALGRNHQEGMIAYGPFHQHIEHMLVLAKSGVVGLSPTEQRTRLKAMLAAIIHEASVFGAGSLFPAPSVSEE